MPLHGEASSREHVRRSLLEGGIAAADGNADLSKSRIVREGWRRKAQTE
jgi:hypothetical protein